MQARRCAGVSAALIRVSVVVEGGVLFPLPSGKYILNEIKTTAGLQHAYIPICQRFHPVVCIGVTRLGQPYVSAIKSKKINRRYTQIYADTLRYGLVIAHQPTQPSPSYSSQPHTHRARVLICGKEIRRSFLL